MSTASDGAPSSASASASTSSSSTTTPSATTSATTVVTTATTDSATAPDSATSDTSAGEFEKPRNPWVPFGWVMPAVWLGFLAYPIAAVWCSPHGTTVQGVSTALVVAFGVVFVVGCARGWSEGLAARSRLAEVLFGVLVLIGVALVPVIGLAVLSFTPFLISYLAFTFPIRLGVVLTAVVWAVALVATRTGGATGDWANTLLILGIVTVSTFATRIVNTRGVEYDRATEALRLAEDRERVARDVHDVLGHSLTVVAVKTELAERLLDVDLDRARQELAEVRALTRTALAEVRETVGGLRVAALADEIASARTALAGAGIESVMPEDLSVVDPRHRTVLAWVLREAVTNVVRHSGAHTCRVSLHPGALIVEDDGGGLRGRREGNGIRGSRERVGGVGGQMRVGPGEDGVGTRLEVRL